MTEPEVLPAETLEGAAPDAVPPDAVHPQPAPPAAAPKRRVATPAIIVAVIVVLLVGAGIWISQNPDILGGGSNQAAAANPEIVTLRQQVQDLAARIARLEAAPKQATPAAAPVASSELTALQARVATLEQKPPPPAPPPSTDPAALAALRSQIANDDQKLAALEQTVTTLTSRVQGADSQTATQLQALQGQVASAGKLSAEVAGLTARAARLTQLQAANAALAAGKPLGTIDGAPPALTRFAIAAPPTEAALRLQFPDLASKSLAAAAPDIGGKPFLDRVWGRMQQAVTIRAGDRVIVGNPAAAILARAQDALDAGDLAGALAELKKLSPDAAAPLAGWLDQANALLAARAALSDIAARA